jgi:hypothetical protein
MIVIGVHFLVGVAASIKARKFNVNEMPNFIVKAIMFTGWLILLDYINKMFISSSMGTVAITGITTLRGMSWLAVLAYYLFKIYRNAVYLGMPRIKQVEDNLNQNCPIDDDKASIFCTDTKEDKK